MGRLETSKRHSSPRLDLLGRRVRLYDADTGAWRVGTVTAVDTDPGGRRANRTRAAAERYEVRCPGQRTPRQCWLHELRPLRGKRWRKTRGDRCSKPDPAIARAVALVGKRVRVWYATVRAWRVATVHHVVLWRAKGVPAGPLLQVVRAGRVNPWCYSLAEIRPIEAKPRLVRVRRGDEHGGTA